MTESLVECIPNFSEGRRMEVIEAIASAIAAVPGVTVLDRHSDPDHNRSVITFAGAPDPVSRAAFAAIAKAAELIDLDQHRGEHPRIGATDVVPFVPLSGANMAQCVELARALGKRVAEELGIPVYLYEAAATRPSRVNLENHRRGEYEGLKTAIVTDPERAPDFGPRRLGKAGATVIGARAPLIAYNVYLTTDDVHVAKRIAATVRQSSGGLPYVKALGMLVDGRAQVSMNLTDYTRTPVARVVELVRREAAHLGFAIHHCELVGLIPQAALVDAAQWYLQLDPFTPEQVLETRLQAARSQASSAPDFLQALAAGTPTPGGGSAAAYAGAMGAALVAMVARVTLGKRKYAAAHARMEAIAARADELRAELERAVRQDAEAFDAVLQAMQMSKDTAEEKTSRAAALEAAMHQAAAVPLRVCGRDAEVLELAVEVTEQGNVSAASDAASAVAMARASMTAASLNVRVNALGIADKVAAEAWLREVAALEEPAMKAEARVRDALRARAGLMG
jgi:glutamate formiminotransferase/formiminotetrahydrofolate cyclodeaminase